MDSNEYCLYDTFRCNNHVVIGYLYIILDVPLKSQKTIDTKKFFTSIKIMV